MSNPYPNSFTLRIEERTAFANGEPFGDVGAYERLRGRAMIEVDPDAPANARVTDLRLAPRLANGRVACAADVTILKPVDMAKGNRRLVHDWANRGNKRILQFFNDAAPSNDPGTAAHAGNGFLMRRGYCVAFVAWQGDLLPGDGRQLLDVPVATRDGVPITGMVRAEFIADAPGITTFPLSGRASTRSYPSVSLDPARATLTRRRYADSPRETIPSNRWQFARVEGGRGLDNQGAEQAVIASDSHIHMPTGFETGWIHELLYEARDPLVLGLGHVAVRDVLAFLRYADVDAAGTANPLRKGGAGIDKVYGWGRSQSGRAIRDFIHQGFNADALGRRVLDGALPHVAGGGLLWMNHRFANAVTSAGQQYEDRDNPADRFPFSYSASRDHLTGKSDAVLTRPDTDPLVMHTQTATEYWQRRGSLVHTDTRGNDLAQPDGVRVYFWSSSQHFADPNLKAPGLGICRQPINVVRTSMLFRALLDAMDAWATAGTLPPPSRVPRRSDGTLVPFEDWRCAFPAIPGVMLPHGPNALPLLDFGEQLDAGLVREPPVISSNGFYATLVPAVDVDGNDIAGVRAPMVAAPLATYTGWNLRSRGFGHGAMHEFSGSTMAFADTPQERAATGDPRPSVAERYSTVEAYRDAIRAAAERLVADRLMLAEDVERCVAAAAGWDRPRHDVRL